MYEKDVYLQLLNNEVNEFKYFAVCKTNKNKEEAQDVLDKYLKTGEISPRNSILQKVNNEWVVCEIVP